MAGSHYSSYKSGEQWHGSRSGLKPLRGADSVKTPKKNSPKLFFGKHLDLEVFMLVLLWGNLAYIGQRLVLYIFFQVFPQINYGKILDLEEFKLVQLWGNFLAGLRKGH